MKKWLKSEIMGLVNSAWVYYLREKSQMLRLEKKKKKERNVILKRRCTKRQIQTSTKSPIQIFENVQFVT